MTPRTFIVGAGLCGLFLFGLGVALGDATSGGGETQTVARTTVTVTTTAEGEQADVPASGYASGYPREVAIAEVPERMRLALGEDERTAVAVAPGVWARRNPGTTVLEDAGSGPLLGWCSSVEKFEATTGRDEPGYCW